MNASVTPLLQKAAAFFQSRRFADALAASEDALRQAPGHPEALHMKALALGRLGRIGEALPVFDETAARHPQRHAVLANKGNALLAAGRSADAIAAYEAAIEIEPRFAAAWVSLGAACRRAGDDERAEGALRKAVALAPRHADAMNNLGVVLADSGRFDEAVDQFSSALRLQPNMISALVNRGAAYRRVGQVEKALADHRKASAMAPDHAEASYQLANSLRQANLLQEAEGAYAAALQAAPDRVDVHRDLARMLWEMGESQRFLAYLDRAIAVRADAALLTVKGELAFRAGLTDVAETAATTALTVDPDNAAAQRVIGRVRRHENNYAAATALFEASLENAPGNFETLHDLAAAHLGCGDFDRAIALLEREPPDEHLQQHIALKANAMRLSGDPEYRRYYDYDRFTKKIMIGLPQGFADLRAFNDALAAAILPLHATKAQPIDQTLYGGTQSFGRLWDEPHPAIQALKDKLLEAAVTFVAELPDDPGHPFLAKKSADLECAGAWSVVLSSGGGHVDHIHPEGWISAVYYVRVPDEIARNDEIVRNGDRAGFLRLGATGVDGVELDPERWFRPQEGAVIFFPSYMWHGVERFAAAAPRITAPFDLAPALSTR